MIARNYPEFPFVVLGLLILERSIHAQNVVAPVKTLTIKPGACGNEKQTHE
jgi:hypothetical protein